MGVRAVMAGLRRRLAGPPAPRPVPGVASYETADWREAADLLPWQLADENARRVADVLDAAGISWWVVAGLRPGRHVIGVAVSDRPAVLRALAAAEPTAACYLRRPERPGVWVAAAYAASAEALAEADILQVGVPTRCRGLSYGLGYGCTVEFWRRDAAGGHGPQQNRASRELSAPELELVPAELAGRPAQTPTVFTRRMLDDIDFAIDVVYTWVDGDDPDWLERRARTLAAATGAVYHPGALHTARFRSRDELRYSLRSVAMYAPWVRTVHLVTDGQVPDWLRQDNPRLNLVPHTAIYDDPAQLPTFNSNSIISRLHHIDGLAEHYLFLNDDVFLGSEVWPHDFFTPAGLARVFPSDNRRPFGSAAPDQPPHLNVSHNIRALLEAELGVTVSRAIRHTPHPQLRSVHFELERRFAAAYANTWSHPFRHHTDIVADQLHHYYVQLTGRGVPGTLSYEYIGLDDADTYLEAMQRLGRQRDRRVFCLNDAPLTGGRPMPDELVAQWLEAYFPVPSEFERLG